MCLWWCCWFPATGLTPALHHTVTFPHTFSSLWHCVFAQKCKWHSFVHFPLSSSARRRSGFLFIFCLQVLQSPRLWDADCTLVLPGCAVYLNIVSKYLKFGLCFNYWLTLKIPSDKGSSFPAWVEVAPMFLNALDWSVNRMLAHVFFGTQWCYLGRNPGHHSLFSSRFESLTGFVPWNAPDTKEVSPRLHQ